MIGAVVMLDSDRNHARFQSTAAALARTMKLCILTLSIWPFGSVLQQCDPYLGRGPGPGHSLNA